MQNILLIVFTSFCFFVGVAQSTTVTVTCSGGGSSCLSPEPLSNTNYTFNVANLPSGYSFSTANWQPTGQNSTGPNGGEVFNATWPNTPSSSNKKLKVTVTFKKSQSPDIVVTSPEVNITVKYISSISSISISGGGVSGSYSNNSTVVVPCGSRTMTLTATPPVTDPSSSVVYEWLLPSGWTGSSTTNSITVTANAGSTDQGLTLRYRRSDSNNFLQAFSLNMDRPQVGFPDIPTSLNDAFCSGETRSVTATAANATSFQWSGTSGISATPNNAATTSISATANGTLTLTVNNACQAPQTRNQSIAFGTPTLYGASPSGSFNYINGNTLLSIQSNSGCVAYKWEIVNGSGYISPNPNYSCPKTFGGRHLR